MVEDAGPTVLTKILVTLYPSLYVTCFNFCSLFFWTVKDLIQVKEWFSHRKDKLDLGVHNHRTGVVTEYYKEGRQRNLKGIHTKKFRCEMSKLLSLFYSSSQHKDPKSSYLCCKWTEQKLFQLYIWLYKMPHVHNQNALQHRHFDVFKRSNLNWSSTSSTCL